MLQNHILLLKLKPFGSGGIRQFFYPSVVNIAAPVKNNQFKSFFNSSLGYELSDLFSSLYVPATFNTTFYLIAGIGNTDFAGSDRFTFNYGGGYRFLLNDSISITTEFRNNIFDVDAFGLIKKTNNLEFSVGAGWFF